MYKEKKSLFYYWFSDVFISGSCDNRIKQNFQKALIFEHDGFFKEEKY